MNKAKQDKFQDKFSLLNKGEQTLYNMLCKAAPDYIVFSQVSMSQIFNIPEYKKAQIAIIGKKSVDFLLCRKDDTSIVLAIELNGPMHDSNEQKSSDETKQAALTEAGIPLVIIELGNIPNQKELGKLLASNVVDRKKNEEIKKEGIQQAKEKQLKVAKKKKSFCASCKKPVTDKVVEFCKSDNTRFKNEIFCTSCQTSRPFQ